jgi:hypothetical protein
MSKVIIPKMIAWKVYKINKTKNVITEGEVKGGG